MSIPVTTISSGDATILRYAYHRIDNLKVNIPALVEVGRAVIASTESAYPRATYSTVDEDSGWGEGKESQFVRIFDSSETTIHFEGILRRNNQAGTVFLAGHVNGDTGIALEDQEKVVAGDIVVVYDHRIPKSFLSRIDSGTFYKRWDVEFDGQTETPKPQPNLGADQQANVDPGTGKATFTLSAATSEALTGNTLSYLWELPTGVSLTGGSVDTDATITVEADAGEYVIACRVEDDTTEEIKRGYRNLFANDPDDSPAFSDTYGLTALENMVVTREGMTFTLTFEATKGDTIPLDRLYTGAPVLLTYDNYWSEDGKEWEQTSEARLNRRTFKGFIRRFDDIGYTSEGGIQSITFVVEDVVTYMGGLPIADQVVIMTDPPTDWTQASPFMCTPAGLAYMLTEFHTPSAFQTSDFYAGDLTGSSVRKSVLTAPSGSMANALRVAANYIPGANIGCHADGRIFMRRNIALESNAYRSGTNNRFTFSDADIAGEIRYSRDSLLRVGETTGGGFVYSGGNTTVYKARMGLGAQMQGNGRDPMQDFIGEDVNDVKQKVGDWHAWINRPTQSITFDTFVDVIDPALFEPVLLDVDSYNPMDNGLLGRRFLPASVRYTWDVTQDGLPPSVTVELEPVTSGKQAELVPTKETGDTYAPPSKIKVTFDQGGWVHYSFSAVDGTTGTPWDASTCDPAATLTATDDNGDGNGGDALQGTGTYTANDEIWLLIDLKKEYKIASIRYDIYADSDDWNSGNGNFEFTQWLLDDALVDTWIQGASDNPVTVNETGSGVGAVAGGEWHRLTITYSAGSPKTRYVLVQVESADFTGSANLDMRVDNIIITLGS